MANITDIAPQANWASALEEGLIRGNPSATGEAVIYSYVTSKVQFKKVWNPVTRASRGLIVEGATGEILARPFAKFFGWSEFSPEQQGELLARDEKVLVSDKLDGSLGILYVDPHYGEAKIATRGSLGGKHAVAATALYREQFEGKWNPLPGYTYLFEILMPGAGIVISYGESTLALIGRVDIATGKSAPLSEIDEWPFRRAEVFPYGTLKEAIEAPERPLAEGVVVHFLESDLRVKIKYDEFVRLHRIGSGISRYRVWEALASGINMEEWKPLLEEEFYAFVDEVAGEMNSRYAAILGEALEAQRVTREKFGEEYSRKDFANFVNGEFRKPIAQFVLNSEFNAARAADYRARLWELVKPPKDFK